MFEPILIFPTHAFCCCCFHHLQEEVNRKQTTSSTAYGVECDSSDIPPPRYQKDGRLSHQLDEVMIKIKNCDKTLFYEIILNQFNLDLFLSLQPTYYHQANSNQLMMIHPKNLPNASQMSFLPSSNFDDQFINQKNYPSKNYSPGPPLDGSYYSACDRYLSYPPMVCILIYFSHISTHIISFVNINSF